MEWAWTCGGQCFGYWEGSDLRTYGGKHIGRRKDDDIFSPVGRYVGEVMTNGRLVTNNARAADKYIMFPALVLRAGEAIQINSIALALYRGYQDFPHPDSF